ncbi:UDP-glycosyltransferase UGT4-like isoform X1 [Musca autumnalis]|uniref:UDP-glycosyltransferase UGT4-like isoform X1 n=1 Tax=Musca autumnalis TaxID=221902 RepID=UPI003CE67E37
MNFLGFVFVIIGFACVALIQNNEASRILSVFPSPSKSHLLIHCAVAQTLAEAGHEVTVLASIGDDDEATKEKYRKADFKFIAIEGPTFDSSFSQEMVNRPLPIYRRAYNIIEKILFLANMTMNHSTMLEFLKEHKAGDFDVMILGYFMNEFMLGLGAHFQCPIILSFMVQPIFLINRMIGNPSESSYVPNLYTGLKQPLSFRARIRNYLSSIFEQKILATILEWQTGKLYRYNFPADRYPPLEEVYKNVSLVLTNHHFSQGPIRPNVPALIEIGGIQIKEKPDPLPQDIAEIMDNAKNGVIYFSLGTNVQGSNLSPDKAKMIFNVLSQLPYTVLMKWGDKDFPGQANNIIYKSWLPQDDILAHPKVKLFITHGGQGSVVESQYHGVPMVGIPFFGDQHSNMANVRNSGFGLSLKYATLTEEDLRETVLEVLNNPKYRENVQQFSKLYRDRPMTPRQLVRYWVDYVIRHNGAKHMQSPAVHMTWWELQSLDVIGFLLLVVFVVVGAIVGLCKLLCCKGKKQAVNLKKKNK